MNNYINRILAVFIVMSLMGAVIIKCPPVKPSQRRFQGQGRRRTPVRTPQRRAPVVRRQNAVPATPANVIAQAIANDKKAEVLNAEINETKTRLRTAPDREKTKLQALLEKQKKESISFLESAKNSFFGVGKIAEQNRQKALLRKPRIERKLLEERASYAKLTDERQRKVSEARQRHLEKKLHLERVALGEVWSGKQKALATAAGFVVAGGVAHYTGALGKAATFATPYAQRIYQWWSGNPDLSNVSNVPAMPGEPSDAEMLSAYGPNPSPGLASRLWEKLPNRPSWLRWGSAPNVSLPSSDTWLGWGVNQGVSFVINQAQGLAISTAMAAAAGWFKNAQGEWETPEGKTVKNADGTNFKPIDEIPKKVTGKHSRPA